ncbi:MAG: hypothetical protein RBS80_25140 [Thermoguttaceae bacterium]|nr:hypothetical protein [Thermoguttaceae bacterium]
MAEFYTGSPIHPDELWFRDAFIKGLWATLQTEHVLITAPRRTGKTSVMDHLADRPCQGVVTVPVFVQDLDHPGDFLLCLLDAFHDKHPSRFRSLFQVGSRWIGGVLDRVGAFEAGGFKVALKDASPKWREDWKSHGDDDFFALVRKKQDPAERVLFIVDEFPDLVLNMHRNHPELLRPFLAWFRGHCTKPRPRDDSIRWLLGGSVNLASTLDSLGMIDLINALDEHRLPVLTPEEVMHFVRRMLTDRNVELSEDLPAEVARRLGRPIPMFMQMITQDLYRIWKRTETRLTVSDVESAFDDLIGSSSARDKLQHYYSRIAHYYDEPKRSAAHALLDQLSVTGDGLAREALRGIFERIVSDQGTAMPEYERKQVFNELLRDLENDFYVEEVAAGRYDFASGLLKAWWRKYYA